VYGNVKGTKKQLAKIHTRCKNTAAAAEWVVDISECDTDNPKLEFDCEARNKKSNRKQIEIAVEEHGGFCIHVKNQYDDIIKGAAITIVADGTEIFNGELPDGIPEMTDLPDSELNLKCEYNGQTVEQSVRLTYTPPPYVPQVTVFEIDEESPEA